MSKQPGVASSPIGPLTILSVSPIDEDHRCLRAIIGHSNWVFFKADGIPPARAFLQQHDISVVLCERDLKIGTWMDVLENIGHMSRPASLIVTSKLADERLWAEALNLGAWDVLSKPFDRSEVLRSVALAGVHWYHQTRLPASSGQVMRAAS
jgi:DNA-binding NtrC family response regulator